MKKIYACLIVVALLCSMTLRAQVQSTLFENNDALSRYSELRVPEEIPVKTMQPVDVQALLDEDQQMEGMMDRPFRFGYGFDVDYKLNDGVWEYLDTVKIWSLKVTSLGAYSLNFIFKDLFLAKGAKLYIFNPNGSMVYGPVTEEQNPSGSWFLSDLVAGDEAIIQLIEPISSEEASSFTISRIVHAYLNVLPSNALNTSLSCNNDVSCHTNWREQADAVALVLLSSGDAHCSGSLLNNTNQDFRPFFLSAFHCIDSNQNGTLSTTEINNAQNWAFRFNYEKTTCGGSVITSYFTYNSANFRAAWVNTDFLLMELVSTAIITDNRVTFLGWDRSGSIPTSGTCIHHPAGDVKKISFDNHSLSINGSSISWTGAPSSPANSHWVVGFDSGTTEGGSSGSPLFNQNGRVVGQLHGGSSGCPPITKYYGRFNLSWAGGGTNSTRLSNWLDTNNTGATVLDILCHPVNLTNQTISTNRNIYSCDDINVQDVTITSGANVNMTAAGSITLSPYFYAQAGSTVHIVSTSPSSNFSLAPSSTGSSLSPDFLSSDFEMIEKKSEGNNFDFTISPNPNDGNFTLNVDSEDMKPYSIHIFNYYGGLVYKMDHCNTKQLQINQSGLPKGFYYVKLSIGADVVTKKIIIH
jgi:hypothetical protein